MAKSKVTLREIAERANVSTALVSNILNGKGRASEKVRKQIIRMLEEAGYRPKHSRKPIFFFLDLNRIFTSGKSIPIMRQLSGIQEVLEEEDITLQVEFLRQTDENYDEVPHHMAVIIRERSPGGVLVSTDAPWLHEACTMFHNNAVPFMQIGYETEIADYDSVVIDSFSGAYKAVTHLYNKGHQKIATIRWTSGIASINSNKKFAGYQAALADCGIPFRPEYVTTIDITQDSSQWLPSREHFDSLMQLSDPPTALFIENSFISLPLLYPLPQDNGKVPESLQKTEMVHFEDWPLDPAEDALHNKLFYPQRKTTLLAIDWEAIGRIASKLLIDRIKNNETNGTKTVRMSPLLQKTSGKIREYIS